MPARAARFLSLTTVLLASACAGARTGPTPAPARPFEYAASTGQYRWTSETRLQQTIMGQSNEGVSSASRLLTITLTRPTPDTLVMTLVVDSITATGPMGMPQGLDRIPGSTYTARLSPAGAFYSATGPSESENQAAAGMTDELGRALPRLTAILAPGAAWTDTVTDKLRQGPLEVDRRIITRFSVVGDTMMGAEPVWRIQRESAVSGSGAGTAMGQSLTLESSGTVTGFLLMSKKGVLMGGQLEEQSTGKAVLAANGMEIGLTSHTTSRLTKVR